MTNKESLFAGLHILMPAIPDGPADAGRRLHRYWYRESRCQVRTGWQKTLCSLWLYLLILAYFPSRSVKICVNPWLMNYLCAYKAPFCAFLWLKNQFDLRNLRLINDLHVCKTLYCCREYSTYVVDSLQIKLFMQNEPKFRKVKLNVNKVLTKDYDKMDTWSIGKNEPKTNPNEPKTNPNPKRPK